MRRPHCGPLSSIVGIVNVSQRFKGTETVYLLRRDLFGFEVKNKNKSSH